MALQVSVQEGVATFTLSNPPREGLKAELMLGCATAIERAKGDESVRAVALRVEGGDRPYGGGSPRGTGRSWMR